VAEKRPALGRGLSALIPEAPVEAPPPAAAPSASAAPRGVPLEVDLDRIVPNPRQPRLQMEQGPLEELAQSIRVNGIIQPILVRRSGDRYEIIAGERRWRAAQIAGLLRAPVVVREIADNQLLQVALIENIQRENLNPIDEATAYRRLLDECAMTQEALAEAVGKDRASIANHLRLLRLPAEVQRQVSGGALSMGHARALVALENLVTLKQAADDVVARALSVRETEALVRRLNGPPTPAPVVVVKDVHTREAEDVLKLALGTKVRIVRKGKGGKVEIDFVSEDELNRIYEHITDKR
jgi:ParB family transcriptional regulator, chromosome partitioning protein